MPRGTSLEETNRTLNRVEQEVLKQIQEDELRASIIYSGQQFTETEPLFADTVGQIMISLNPAYNGGRSVEAIADAVEANVLNIPGPTNISYYA